MLYRETQYSAVPVKCLVRACATAMRKISTGERLPKSSANLAELRTRTRQKNVIRDGHCAI